MSTHRRPAPLPRTDRRRGEHAHLRRRSSRRPRLVGASIVIAGLLGASVTATGSTFALMTNTPVGGPEQLVSAGLSPAPTGTTATNNGCIGTNLRTNVGLNWSDAQSATPGANGGSLVSGYSIGRAIASTGPFSTATTVAGSPAPLSTTDAPPVGTTSGILIANTANQVLPLSEATLSTGAAVTIGTTGNQVNAMQISPDGLTAVVAEFGSNQVHVLNWTGSTWGISKTIVVTGPTAVAIDPVPNSLGLYVAYVVSDPGTKINGSVFPITLSGASTTMGTAIAVQRQASPTAIVVSPNGVYVYVANYTTSTSAVSSIALPGGSPQPIALAVTFESSHVYVADRANGFIDDITASSNTVTAHVTLAAGGLNDGVLTSSGNPNVLAMMPSGASLYVAEFGTGEVQVVSTALGASPDTISATISTGASSQPIDLTVSPNGCTVYGADWPSDRIFSIPTSTNVSSTLITASCQTQDPQALAVTPDNQYLIVPENYSCGNVQMVNTSTSVVTTIATVGTTPVAVAIQPVPLWYQSTATHSLWSSIPSTTALFSVGWNQGGWQ
jgi:DNA-binding beta-propeller fold protein YncE